MAEVTAVAVAVAAGVVEAVAEGVAVAVAEGVAVAVAVGQNWIECCTRYAVMHASHSLST